MRDSSPRVEIDTNTELEARIRQSLAAQHYRNLRTIDIAARSGTVTISGEVSTFHVRQLALSVCGQVDGVNQVVDRLSVASDID